jgi:hypothetical protein
MALQPVYLVASKNLAPFLEAIRHAQAPEKVGLKFLEELGFKSTNDRLFIPLMKALRFLDEGGRPTARYHAFLDDTQWKYILADGIKDAYSDIFRVSKNAHELTREQLAGKIKTVGEGKISPSILKNMTKTFLDLVKLADFSSPGQEPAPAQAPEEVIETAPADEKPEPKLTMQGNIPQKTAGVTPSLVYRIEIVLPAVRDQAIYDAIFKSAKEHLLK